MCEDENTLTDVMSCDLVEGSDHALTELLCWLTIWERIPATRCSRDADDVYMTLVDSFGKDIQIVPFLDNRDRLYFADTKLGKAFHKSELQAEIVEERGSCFLAAA